ncbi:MAG TPA: NAD(P)-dependent oxidoreductase [Vicinamibacteria bacterium]|nr:NAD(P)-dependent oxidoreductase [Vicinamibacteria bacterium]
MPRLVVTGAGGFVGRHVVSAARAEGWDVAGLVRSEEAARTVTYAGGAPVRVPLLSAAALAPALAGADAVVHLAQIGSEAGGATYEAVNVAGTQAVVSAAAEAGVPRIVFFSGLGVARYGMASRTTNRYFLSKLRAEALLFASGLEVVVFRPSYVVGPRDGLVSSLLRQMAEGEVEKIGDGSYRMQPIAVKDAAAAVMAAASGPAPAPGRGPHRVIDLVGPAPVRYVDLVRLLAEAARAQRRPADFRFREVPVEEADRRARAGQDRPPDELDCLLCDETGDTRPLEALLGRFLVPVEEALAAAVRGTPPAGRA